MGITTMDMPNAAVATVRELLSDWLQEREPFQGPDRRAYCHYLVLNLSAAWGDLEIGDIDEARVRERFRARRGAGLKGTTLNTERAALRCFFNWAVARGLLERSPMRSWPPLPQGGGRRRALTLEEQARLCGAIRCREPALIARFVGFLAATGLRPVTVRRLRGRHLSREGDAVWLRLSADLLKNGEGLNIELSPAAVAALPDPFPQADEPVFPGLPKRESVWRIVSEAGERAGLGRVGPYCLRGTWVARMAGGGASVQEVMAIQNWREMNVLTRHYFPAVPRDRLRELYRRVEAGR